jgi:hypothetical protein
MKWEMMNVEGRRMKFRVSWAALCFALSATAMLAQSTNDIPPLRPALREIPPTIWELYGVWIVIGIVVVIALKGVLIWWLLQPRSVVPEPIELQTRRELEALRQRAEDGKTLSEISRCVRRYFATAFELSAGELTTTEFCQALAASGKCGGELAAPVSDFLRRADERKFAPVSAAQSGGAVDEALKLFHAGEARRAELRQLAKPT